MIPGMDMAPVTADTRVILRRLTGGALFLCLVSSAERYSQLHALPLGARALVGTIDWAFWAAIAPVVLVIVRRIDQRATVAERTTWHAVAAAGLMLCHSAALYYVQRSAHLVDLHVPLWSGAFVIARWRLTSNLLAYVSIVGVIRFSDAERVASDRQRATVRLSEQLSAAQLEALRLQLNPHFLFNSLNTVAMLVRRGAAPDAVRAITRLAELLRQLLRRDGSQFISLREELSFLDRYLDLERLRFGDRLRIVHEIDDDALDACVPPFLLQPVVENAIRHGIGRVVAGGTLRILARRVGGQLQIEITDDGPGMVENRMEPPGIGLANTVGRLGELYGSAFDLDIRSMPGGTVARISFPAVPMISALRSAS
jgi:LytS/YehU family sensor histidine kinase